MFTRNASTAASSSPRIVCFAQCADLHKRCGKACGMPQPRRRLSPLTSEGKAPPVNDANAKLGVDFEGKTTLQRCPTDSKRLQSEAQWLKASASSCRRNAYGQHLVHRSAEMWPHPMLRSQTYRRPLPLLVASGAQSYPGLCKLLTRERTVKPSRFPEAELSPPASGCRA
jgi:hypothetical protein